MILENEFSTKPLENSGKLSNLKSVFSRYFLKHDAINYIFHSKIV